MKSLENLSPKSTDKGKIIYSIYNSYKIVSVDSDIHGVFRVCVEENHKQIFKSEFKYLFWEKPMIVSKDNYKKCIEFLTNWNENEGRFVPDRLFRDAFLQLLRKMKKNEDNY